MTAPSYATPHGTRKLGCIKPKARPKCPRFSRYFAVGSIPLPEQVSYSEKAASAIKRMYLNDQLGCCVISDVGHQTALWSANDSDSGGMIEASDNEILAAYRIFNPGRQDNGCVISDVLDYRHSRGLTMGGKLCKIDGYVSVNYTRQEMVKAAILLFGSLTIGIDVPSSWVESADGSDWSTANAGWSMAGGHDICAVGYNQRGVIISTWGGLRTFLWEAFTSGKFVTECYASLSPNWYNADGIAASGFKVAALKEDLEAIGWGSLPDLGPSPTPDTPPPDVPPAPVDPTPAPLIVTGKATGTITVPTGGLFGHTVNVPVTLAVTGIAQAKTSAAIFDRLRFVEQIIDQVRQLGADLKPVYELAKQIGDALQKPYEDVLAILHTLGIRD